MDPRHPELAISRMRELMKQYDRIEKDMAKATTSAKLAEPEKGCISPSDSYTIYG